MLDNFENNIIPDFPRLANMTWTFDLGKYHVFCQSVISHPANMAKPTQPFAS